MISMCGLICRFFHGWRQSEAVALMRQVAVLPQTSLLVEKCDQLGADEAKSVYCQPLYGIILKKQILWRENGKHVLTVTPKQRVNLVKWTKFGSSTNSKEDATTNTETVSPLSYTSANEITVLLEASYNNKGMDGITDQFITVSEMAELYAWSCKEMFGIIIKTTPSQFVSMIHAFLNNSLFLEDCLQICKMSTVDTSGTPKMNPTTAEETCTNNVTQIVHNLENQIESVASGNDSRPANPLVEIEESSLSGCSTEIHTKPPNILIYVGDNCEYFQDVKETLLKVINSERYVVYQLTNDMAYQPSWRTHSALLVICGDVTTHIDTIFIRHLLEGGQVLSVCSDFLKFAVPLYGSVEFAESAVVSLSYGKWKNVQLLHHKHCFHSSPKRKRNIKLTGSSAVSLEPSLVEINDEFGNKHNISLQVLANDNTWGAPALLLADVNGRSGRAIFSQVHLEKNPQTGISDQLKACHLEQSNEFRLQILRDLLSSQFYLDVNTRQEKHELTPAYLIGDGQSEFVSLFSPHANKEGYIQRPTLNFCFVRSADQATPSENLLPIITGENPSHFSATKYIQALKTRQIGRSAIYCEVITSTMHALEGYPLMPDGFAVICGRQTKGRGRSGNHWISPMGCALMSFQLHIPKASQLGRRLPFLQHLVSMSACLAVKQWIPLHIKWPNDIYLGEDIKIGGVIVEASSDKLINVVNVGLGVNLNNANPTTCINNEIRKKNEMNGTNIPIVDLEIYSAEVFNCLEMLVHKFQDYGPDAILETYYSLWLHTNAKIQVSREHQPIESATVTGIDEFGFLVARLQSGQLTNLHPDGNSFDMMEGLVYQK